MSYRFLFQLNRCSISKITMKNSLPYFSSGKVVKGFGRGSKSLGTPTANFDQMVVDQLPKDLPAGIYFGWAQVNQSPVYPMVTSLGWNPYFGNEKKSMETHILHEFSDDFYGSDLKICLAGYLREEKNFDSLDALKAAIQCDIDEAKKLVNGAEYECLPQNSFFSHVEANPKVTIPATNGEAI